MKQTNICRLTGDISNECDNIDTRLKPAAQKHDIRNNRSDGK